jgi:glyoxylase-like metal-dependent hydrolase (beta-lactamase superfamily II)
VWGRPGHALAGRRTQGWAVVVRSPRRKRTGEVARQIAPGVFCLGPWGHTQTAVYFVRSGRSWALVDAGWASDGPRIERAAGSLFGTGSHPAAILLTHCHPDHAGSALRLARAWDCPVYLHPAELPVATGEFAAMVATAGPLDQWVILPLMRAMGRRRREAVLARGSLGHIARSFEPGSGVPGLPGWQCIPTPGHTRGHVSYFRPADRVLIAGDALVTVKINSLAGLLLPRPGLSGPPWYTTWNRRAAGQSIGRLARLEPAVLAGGHGNPMTGTGTAAAVSAFAGLISDR